MLYCSTLWRESGLPAALLSRLAGLLSLLREAIALEFAQAADRCEVLLSGLQGQLLVALSGAQANSPPQRDQSKAGIEAGSAVHEVALTFLTDSPSCMGWATSHCPLTARLTALRRPRDHLTRQCRKGRRILYAQEPRLVATAPGLAQQGVCAEAWLSVRGVRTATERSVVVGMLAGHSAACKA